MALIILALALQIDRLFGDPDWLWRKISHPVVLFGAAIGYFERRFNREPMDAKARRSYGVTAIIALLFASLLAGWLIHRMLTFLGPMGILIEVVIVAVFLAQKSLGDHVANVATGLRQGGLEGGRHAVSQIVGRDPNSLDEPGVCRAAIESLAENFSDGVVAPALFYAVLGLPGLFAYKMLNTADSMIGHKSPRYRQFGWAAARLDDLANWPAARLSMVLIAAGAWLTRGRQAARNAFYIGMTDHGLHRSPNSGWPEATIAGALDIALAGPRIYDGERVSEPMLNGAGRQNIGARDIEDAIEVFYSACRVFNGVVVLFALIWVF